MWRVVKPSMRDVNEGYPLAFLTPDGTDKAAEKRKETGIHWALEHSESYDKDISERTESFPNLPRDGFRIAKAVKRTGWNGGNVVWRIEDPYGFTVEIQSGNLQNILESCTVDKGLIFGKCVWARDGASNILLPMDTEEYRQAIRNTENLKVSFNPDDVPLGSTVKLRNGKNMIWLGQFFIHQLRLDEMILDPENNHQVRYLDPFVKCSDKAKFCFYDPNEKFEWRGKTQNIYAYSKFDIIEVVDTSCLMTVNTVIANKMLTDCRVYTGKDLLWNTVALTRYKTDLEWRFETEEVPKDKWPVVDHVAKITSRKMIAKYQWVFYEYSSFTSRWSHMASTVNFNELEEFSDKKFKIKRVPVQQRGIYAREPYLQKVTYNHSMIPGNEFTGQFYYLNIFFPQLNITAQISE